MLPSNLIYSISENAEGYRNSLSIQKLYYNSVGDLMKTLELPEVIYQELYDVSEELSAIVKKPMSLNMTLYLILAVYRAHLSEPCARDAFRQKLACSNIMSPDEFDKSLDKF
jgi:hypothetical protein